MKRYLVSIIAAAALLASCNGPKDGEYTFRILTTNDVHGRYFDSLYVEDKFMKIVSDYNLVMKY